MSAIDQNETNKNNAVDDDTKGDDQSEAQPFVTHLIELRTRLLKGLCAILIVFSGLFYFANDIYSLIAAPLIEQLSPESTMIATEVASPFMAPFKLTLFAAVFIAMPYLLVQAWGFIAPGLYQQEQRLARPLIIISILLFYAGTAFAYFVVFPLVFGFFTRVAPEGVTVMTDISKYLDFVTTLFLAFGITFEVPIATIILVATGITTVEKLSKMRGYVLVGAFALGMMLTPPDVISQTLLAVPMCLLFEIGLLMSRILLPHRVKD